MEARKSVPRMCIQLNARVRDARCAMRARIDLQRGTDLRARRRVPQRSQASASEPLAHAAPAAGVEVEGGSALLEATRCEYRKQLHDICLSAYVKALLDIARSIPGVNRL